MAELKFGRIHSTESFGTVDGPGVRFVVFFQGCPMRCQYCHNPDTWEMKSGTEMSVEQLLEQYNRNKTFYRKGGITATGGEPLMQLEFLTELFAAAKEQGIHTCLDTSGIAYRKSRTEKFQKLFKVTDLVLLDIKHSLPEGHETLTGQKQEHILEFLDALDQAKIPVVIRHVVVPGITDGDEELTALGRILAPHRNIRGLEILPYHTMGIAKYKNLGLDYPLEGVPQMEPEAAKQAKAKILAVIKECRNK
ncbi:MAG: pyruvate formate-lyase-activating protein [Eubacteriales bacterium]|nr:pyruvate formate-lyase-activating protein [Eubacteriales bacterium]